MNLFKFFLRIPICIGLALLVACSKPSVQSGSNTLSDPCSGQAQLSGSVSLPSAQPRLSPTHSGHTSNYLARLYILGIDGSKTDTNKAVEVSHSGFSFTQISADYLYLVDILTSSANETVVSAVAEATVGASASVTVDQKSTVVTALMKRF